MLIKLPSVCPNSTPLIATKKMLKFKTNPVALISWYFESKEIFTNYRYNLTLNQQNQIDDIEFSDLNNVQLFESILTINSFTQY